MKLTARIKLIYFLHYVLQSQGDYYVIKSCTTKPLVYGNNNC